MILMAYRHGLRASEVVDLRWDQIDFDTANLSVRRTKKGSPSTHPILGDELRALRRLNREQEPQVGIRLYLRAGVAVYYGGPCSACRARWCGCRVGLQSSPAHAAPRLWICPSQ
jgi:Phage integrase family